MLDQKFRFARPVIQHRLESTAELSIAVDPAALAPLGNLGESLATGRTMMSIVIPLLNEVESITELYRRIKAAVAVCAPRHEIIFVDDGSTDGSFAALKAVWKDDPLVSVVSFRRNFGKAAALDAGFRRVRGETVVIMDADLQDQPEELPRLIAKMDEGYDLVTGWKRRRHDPLNKTLPSKLFNGTVSRYFNIKIHDFNCGFKIMTAGVARDLTLYGDLHRFIPVLAADRGYRVAECVVEHAPRIHGVSKYGAKRLITGLLDFVSTILTTRYLNKPMQFFGALGLSAGLLGVLTGFYLLIETILGHGGAMRPLWVAMAILILGGIQLVCLGLLAEVMVKFSNQPAATTHNLREVLAHNSTSVTDQAEAPVLCKR